VLEICRSRSSHCGSYGNPSDAHRPRRTRRLLNRQIDLDTHISDIVGLFEYRDLHDVIFVGHSYGGTVVTGIAERVPDRIRRLVYLDAP
jgi:pimeloyl-ACP methyl ester carboxylesterase